MNYEQHTIAGVERRPVDQILPYGRNPNQHPSAQLEKLARSIQEHGRPVTLDGDGRTFGAIAVERGEGASLQAG